MSKYIQFKQVPYYKESNTKVDSENIPPYLLEKMLKSEEIYMKYENIKGEEISLDSVLKMLKEWEDECA